jgi:hypothetical protein
MRNGPDSGLIIEARQQAPEDCLEVGASGDFDWEFALHSWSGTSAEQLSCSLRLLGFVPMHSDSQRFVRAAI